MQVILLQDVAGTGAKGDVKNVADGFARNFLFPRKLARMATKAAIHDLQKKEAKAKKENERELKDSQKLASKLDGAEIEIKEKVNEGGTLYGAVSADTVAAAIKKELKLTVAPKQVIFPNPIKETGTNDIRIECGHGLEADIKLTVSEA